MFSFLDAASSPYFRMAFTSLQSAVQVDVPTDTLECLLDYIYTRRCALSLDNVASLIDVAKLCQMPSLFQYCCEYLLLNLNGENILQLYEFAKLHADSKLFDATYTYMMQASERVRREREKTRRVVVGSISSTSSNRTACWPDCHWNSYSDLSPTMI